MKISELFGTDWVSRKPENPEIPELLGKLARIRGYDHSEVMSTIVSDWKSTLHHLGVQRSDLRATEQDFPFIYEFPEFPKFPKIFPKKNRFGASPQSLRRLRERPGGARLA